MFPVRGGTEYAGQGTPDILLLDRSPRAAIKSIRETLDCWFERFPVDEKQRLRRDFRSHDKVPHASAFFELYCHELFSRLFDTVVMHALDATGRAKDFLIANCGKHVEIEATICVDQETVNERTSAQTQVLDYLAENAFVPGIRFSIEHLAEGTELPSLSRVARSIKEWACKFDRVELRNILEDIGVEALPLMQYEENSWYFEIRPIPLSHDDSETVGFHNAIGIGPIQGGFLNHDRSLRNTIRRKVRHYDSTELAYVIAVDTIFQSPMTDEFDILNALIGTEAVRFDPRTNTTTPTRTRDGIWVGPPGPVNRHLSAVLLFNNLLPWTVSTVNPTLYLNPYASFPLSQEILPFNKVSWEQASGEMRRTSGGNARQILGLPIGWPGD